MNKPVFLRRYGLVRSAVIVPVLLAAALLLAGSAQPVSGYSSGLADGAAPPSAYPLPQSPDSTPAGWPQTGVEAAFRSSPVMFIENAGQFDERARFQVWGATGTMWLAEDAIWITVLETPPQPSPTSGKEPRRLPPVEGRTEGGEPRRGVNIKLTFPGANPHPRIEPFDCLDTMVSYFIGNDPARWRSAVPVWGGVRYVDLYPGVDLEVNSKGGRLVQRLVTRAGAGLSVVRLRVDGTDALALEGDRLRLTTAVGEYTLPLLQMNDPSGTIPPSPNLTSNQVASPFASAISSSESATSSPQSEGSEFAYATFLGGGNGDRGQAIAVGEDGSAYMAGIADSTDFPTSPGAFDTSHNGNTDAFVLKLDSDGDNLVYATFLGGSNADWVLALALDGTGAIYVAGPTYSDNFPTTPGAFDSRYHGSWSNNSSDAFVARLTLDGRNLVYSTYLGGVSWDIPFGLAVDGAGAAYVGGETQSPDFPFTSGAFDTSFNSNRDAFVVKLAPDGGSLVYATFLGASQGDSAGGIALDGTSAAYVVGYTGSLEFPVTSGAFDTSFNGGNSDVFVAKLAADGGSLVYATFLGGSGDDGYPAQSAVAVDISGVAYVAGLASSSDFPTTPGAFDTSSNSIDAFVAKLAPDGRSLAYATFLGGDATDMALALAIDRAGAAYVTGYTRSFDFPTTPGAFDTSFNGGYGYEDAFVAKLPADGGSLVYATYLGGGAFSGWEAGHGIAVDRAGNAYVTGGTPSSDFPTTSGAFDTSFNGGYDDAFVVKLAVGGGVEPTHFIAGRLTDNTGNPVTGATVSASGPSNVSTTTGADGTYTLSNLPAGPYTLTPSKSGYTFSPTSRTVIVPPDVMGVDFTGTPISTPVQGSLRLTAASSYTPAQPIASTVRVDNPTGTANAYTVIVSLLQGGATVDSQPRSVTVPGGGSETRDFNFGTWPAGSYRLRAELQLGEALLSTQTVDISVLDPGAQRLAEDYAGKLKQTAGDEFDQMAGIPARAFAKDVILLLLDKIENAILNHLLDVIAPFKSPSPESITAQIQNRLADIKVTKVQMARRTRLDLKRIYGIEVPSDFDPLNPVLTEFIADPLLLDRVKGDVERVVGDVVKESVIKPRYTDPEMSKVRTRDSQFRGYLSTHTVVWRPDIEQVFDRGKDLIANTVESDVVFTVGPYDVPVLGTLKYEATLIDQQNVHDFLAEKLKLISVILVLVGLALLITGVGTAIAAVIWKVALLLGSPWMKVLAMGVAAFMLIFSVPKIAPNVTSKHDNTLDAVESIIGSQGQALKLEDFTITSARREQPVRLLAKVESNEVNRTANPLVETAIYSIDGRVVKIVWANPAIQPHQTTLLEREITLPAGRYKAVSTIHTGDQIAIVSQAQTFAVTQPALQLGANLNKSQFALGEAVRASITVTNTDVISGVNDLTLIVESSDGQNFNAWPISLDAGEAQQADYTFVPPAGGSYVLRATLTLGLNDLATRDVAYVVGSGASLALNVGGQEVYDTGIAVAFPITATNAGNLLTSTVLSLVTLDRLHDLTTVYTDTLPLSVDAGASVATTATALPVDLAQPGLYTTRLFLGDDLYTSLDFAVSAEDTLFADIYPDTVFPTVSDPVTLTVQVMNSVYTYTDALVDVSLWQPDGITQTVAMSSIGTGQYQGTVTAPITGTYLTTVEVSKPNYRAVGNSTFFVAGQHSQLLPTVDGRPILGTTQPVTMTVRNEHGASIVGASLVVSGSLEYLSRQTDAAGQAVLHLSPTITEPYQISLEKLGFAQTLMDLPVWVAPDTTPPALFLDVPSITNRTPLTVTGLTEAGAGLTVNSQAVAVDAQGRFTTTVALSEGDNTLNAAATDVVSNTTTITRAVTLDTVPPVLSVTDPTDGLFSLQEVISVTGSTEVEASLTVSGTLATVHPASGAFNAWVLLQPGVNIVPVAANDEAGNTATTTRSVAYSCLFGDFDGDWQVDAADLQAVATRWRKIFEPLYDLDTDGYITVADVMRVATRWGDTCP